MEVFFQTSSSQQQRTEQLEDRRRYFIVGSAILEIATPLFHRRLEKHYKEQGLDSFQDFIDTQPIKHLLFHLRHRNVWCCTDLSKCENNMTLPLTHGQWALLYTEQAEPGQHHCHCQFRANPVELDELDIALSALILLNCCSLEPVEEEAIETLAQFKEDYLSYNERAHICEDEFDTFWDEMKTSILRLDPTMDKEITRIVSRPLDEKLCTEYYKCLLEMYQKLLEVIKNKQCQCLHCH